MTPSLTLSLVGGIYFYEEPLLLTGLCILLILISLIFIRKIKLTGLMVILLLICTCYYGAVSAQRHFNTHLPFTPSGKTTIRFETTTLPIDKETYISAEGMEQASKQLIRVMIKKNTQNEPIRYGQILELTGQFKIAEKPRNPGAFDYPAYLKVKGIKGIFYADHVRVVQTTLGNPLKRLSYTLKKKILAINRETLPRPWSELYTGLVFGDHGTDLPDEMMKQFRLAGLTHLIVVSGSQVALLTGILLAFLRQCPIRPPVLFWIITAANSIFYFLTGGGPSIFRAILMCEIALGISLLQRKSSPYHILALTALVMLLISPGLLFDLGAQLSFLATFALLLGARQIEDALPRSWPGWIRASLAVSLAPFLFTTPLLWYRFYNVSPVSLLSNLLVVNWIEILVVVGFFSTIIGFVLQPLCYIINQFSLLVMMILHKTVAFVTQIPFGVLYIRPPSVLVILALYMLLFLGLYQLKEKRLKEFRISLLATVTSFLFLIAPSFIPSKYLTVTFLDVGQGDAILIETPRRKHILIDAGMSADGEKYNPSRDMGERVVLPALWSKGINKLDVVIVSHFDMDHMGGIPAVLKDYRTGMILENGQPETGYTRYETILAAKKIPRRTVRNGHSLILEPGITLQVLYPFRYDDKASKNNNSLVLKLVYGEIEFLFTGDLEEEKETELATFLGNELNADILKAGHHGSNTSSIPAFLSAVSPAYAVISAGQKNRYGHPSPTVLNRLQTFGVNILRTDLSGAIEFKTDGRKLLLKTYVSENEI